MKSAQRRGVGIDLGTTNCALAHLPLADDAEPDAEQPEPETQELLQVIEPGEVSPRPLLPSFLYVAGEHELPAGGLDLPWSAGRSFAVGEFARDHGSKLPGRLVSSAKSWLCQSGVDRREAILPWKGVEGVERLSPVTASARYVEHLSAAWRNDRGAGLPDERVVLAVPASFDAAARDLTVEAAAEAGLPEPILLEEPQAALYAWIGATRGAWRKQVRVGDVILVCDVGGGTTDLSLIAVSEEKGELALTRLAVGDHILLGGDNMDLALAHQVQTRLASGGTKLGGWQFQELGHVCRTAKERILLDAEVSEVPVAITGRGSSLVGGTIRAAVPRAEAEQVLLEGFFPRCEVTRSPQEARALGLAEWGLQYAADPAITAHLGAFLCRHAGALGEVPGPAVQAAARAGFVQPTAVLFNGGVFRSSLLRERMMSILNQWISDANGKPARELPAVDFDRAVALGSATYAWVRESNGLRIRGGLGHAYYVGVETAMPAVPGMPAQVDGVCVAALGMEEGTESELPGREFGLVVGQPTEFRFFCSPARRTDRVGAAVESWDLDTELKELPPLVTTLEGEGREGTLVPVQLRSVVTEVGTLQLWCVERDGPGRWKLEFDVRTQEA
jgi:molecular chaperone DnaK (HSP70)